MVHKRREGKNYNVTGSFKKRKKKTFICLTARKCVCDLPCGWRKLISWLPK